METDASMGETRLCEYCGVRPVRPARTSPGDHRRIRVRYCEVCRPIVMHELRRGRPPRAQRRRKERLEVVEIGGEEVPTRKACLSQIGTDYLAMKRAGRIRPVELDESTF